MGVNNKPFCDQIRRAFAHPAADMQVFDRLLLSADRMLLMADRLLLGADVLRGRPYTAADIWANIESERERARNG